MDIMTPPNKETLEFYRKILQWVDHEERTEDGRVYIFKAETPPSIVERFEEIKTELPFYEIFASESSRIMSDKK